MPTGTITITARKRRVPTPFELIWKPAPPTVVIDEGPETELPWGVETTFQVDHGEHDVVVTPSIMEMPIDTCCWVDEEGVRLEVVVTRVGSISPNRFRYLD